jgi:asparagine synthase (glutamine-hydrolysing)
MCGLAGILALAPRRPVARDELERMAGQLVHRGPDAGAYYVDPRGRFGLGFRRLSIIDLPTGGQPLCNEDRTIWAAFNGEIYNFRELRRELTAAGHAFVTQGDAEVIVHAYEQFGAACFERLSGMFAIALWDEQRGVLHLARDRLGKKPLVMAEHEGRLYFASEAKAILALPEVPRRIDAQSLHRYLVFQYVPAPYSIFRGFSKLLPGHRREISAAADRSPAQVAYWSPPRPEPSDRLRSTSLEHAVGELDGLLTRAVEQRLVSDVPLGAFLSGGVDSSIVVGLMRRLGVSPLRTFSIGFEDARYDETRYARQVAALFQTEHHEQRVTPRAAEILPTLAHHFDEPFGDSSAIPTWYVSKFARQFVTVALTGDGGDECFAGYDRYRALQLARRLDWLPAIARRALAASAALLPHGRAKSLANRMHRFGAALGERGPRRYLNWVGVFTPDMLRDLYAPEFAQGLDLGEPAAWLERACEAAGGDDVQRANYADFVSYLPYDLLTKVDVASMACSLECRSPLLDHQLVEFALRLPMRLKLGPAGSKLVLKTWARRLLPREILHRRKAGFGVPVGEWFRGDLEPLLRERVLRRDGIAARLFRPEATTRLVEDHITGRANHEHRLWLLLMLELWQDAWAADL